MNRPCELCGIRIAEQAHHLFSQTKHNRKKYGSRLEHPGNIMYLCSVCHLNKSIPKLRENEFLEATKEITFTKKNNYPE
jgi:5-methylcytosine-specific restriction endonuclease McrA